MGSHWKRFVSSCPILVLIVSCCFVSCLDLEEFKFETLDKLKDAWSGGDQAIKHDLPSQFSPFLAKLNAGIDTSVWIESYDNANDPSIGYRTYKLVAEYCGVTKAEIRVKYFLERGSAYTFPCIDPNYGTKKSYCYLKNLDPEKTEPEWLEETFDIDFDKEIELELKIALLPEGYIVFDKISIFHDGDEAPIEGCVTTTTEADSTTTTEDDTTVDPTTESVTETHDSEGTDNTWNTLPSTTPTTTTTTQTTTTTTGLPPITDDVTEDEDSEELTTTEIASTTDDPTTETLDPTTPDSSDSTSPDPPVDPTSTTGETPSTPESPTTTTRPTPPFSTTSATDDEGGLTLKQILLYIVLPVAILLLLLLTIACYCGIRSHRLKQGRHFKNLKETHSNGSRNAKSPNNITVIINDGAKATPNQSWFYHLTGYNAPNSHPPTSIPEPNGNLANGTGNGYYYSTPTPVPASPAASHRSYAFPPPPPNPQNSVLLSIPDSAYKYQQSPNGNIPRSNRSSFSSSSKFPLYTGEYTEGNNLPRMRRNY